MKRQRYITMSQFICQQCGTELVLPRLHCGQRKKNHIKTIYCPTCKKDANFKEIKYNEFNKKMTGELLRG